MGAPSLSVRSTPNSWVTAQPTSPMATAAATTARLLRVVVRIIAVPPSLAMFPTSLARAVGRDIRRMTEVAAPNG